MLAPVFPGCHVICRPATCHGIEPPPFLPSLDKRAGIEPALSLLVAGIEPAPTVFRHGRSRLKLYQLSYTNKEASYSQVTGGVVGPDKLSARNWLACWRSVSWIIRRIKLRTKPRKGTRQSYQNPPASQAEFRWLRGYVDGC